MLLRSSVPFDLNATFFFSSLEAIRIFILSVLNIHYDMTSYDLFCMYRSGPFQSRIWSSSVLGNFLVLFLWKFISFSFLSPGFILFRLPGWNHWFSLGFFFPSCLYLSFCLTFWAISSTIYFYLYTSLKIFHLLSYFHFCEFVLVVQMFLFLENLFVCLFCFVDTLCSPIPDSKDANYRFIRYFLLFPVLALFSQVLYLCLLKCLTSYQRLFQMPDSLVYYSFFKGRH